MSAIKFLLEKNWEFENIEHKGFTDMGNYIIKLPDYTDPTLEKTGLALNNAMGDHGKLPKFGCTAMAKRNSKGEVIIGRNMDLDISQNPAYLFRTTYGKYTNICVQYSPGFYLPYSEVQKLDEIDKNIHDALPYMACDCLNEKGLYIEVDLREKNDRFTCYGLHSTHGETVRDDGTPWSELRACNVAATQLMSQNCATVKEAVAFLKNSYDWYTVSPPDGVNLAIDHNNMCFLIGDATGEFGLIEMARDEINYLPYQCGHANFYITPKWRALETYGTGIGRLGKVYDVIEPVETLEDAMKAMEPIMWRNATLWIGESERSTDGTHLHPYDQILFKDDKGTPQIDWRSDYVYQWPVLDDGRMLIDAKMISDAEKCTYDPKIREYFDAGIASGYLVVDDGSFKFSVGEEELTLTELYSKYVEYGKNAADPEKNAQLKPYYEKYWELLTKSNTLWVQDEPHFEALKAPSYARLHIRYDENGEVDLSCMSKYEKLIAFYGYGTEKDEKPLRDDASIWTTSLNVGVNCANREMKIRFWENSNVVCHMKFED